MKNTLLERAKKLIKEFDNEIGGYLSGYIVSDPKTGDLKFNNAYFVVPEEDVKTRKDLEDYLGYKEGDELIQLIYTEYNKSDIVKDPYEIKAGNLIIKGSLINIK